MKHDPKYSEAVKKYDAAQKLRQTMPPRIVKNQKKFEKDMRDLSAALLNAGKPKVGDSVRDIALCVVVTCGFVFVLAWLMLEAAVREDEAREQTRIERCARMGENTPPEFLEYCRGLQ